MVLLNALSAKNGKVVGAVKVLHSLVVFVAQKAIDALFVFKIDVS